MRNTVFIWLKLAGLMLLSSMAQAHEVVPTIGNFTMRDGRLELSLRLNAEALLAGIDLDGLADTNEAGGAAGYDALRALTPAALAARMRDGYARVLGPLTVTVDSQPVRLALQDVTVPDMPSDEMARPTTVVLTASDIGAGEMTLLWPRGYGTLILRQNGVEAPYTATIQGGDTAVVPLSGSGAQSGWVAFAQYVPVGFDHILPKGLDHILFVLGLFFLSTQLGPLLWQVSAFTVAHTVTLALGALGWVTLPAAVVEPLIAASICFVAVENILSRGLTPWRPVVVFGFGLLHGLGFASVLEEFGLPEAQFIPALLGFNVGVELGQLTVIALAFLAVGAWFRKKPWYRSRITVPASALIALTGAYWVVERVFL
ncbi:HupE/UreJ family protein [Thalassovita sp.]|uniref:HupE/UreJ family protein n=1 Tax=Thalassovita sp. TaxID=1979401 RepID=UPI0029DE6164|nr:HupE/UreJ family protein [Thalassovita sp.]